MRSCLPGGNGLLNVTAVFRLRAKQLTYSGGYFVVSSADKDSAAGQWGAGPPEGARGGAACSEIGWAVLPDPNNVNREDVTRWTMHVGFCVTSTPARWGILSPGVHISFKKKKGYSQLNCINVINLMCCTSSSSDPLLPPLPVFHFVCLRVCSLWKSIREPLCPPNWLVA